MATNPIDTASEFITQLYIGYFNRAPDPDGLNYWIGRYNAGMSLVDIANSFAAQSEATSTYGYLAAPNVGSQSSFIQSVYQNLFGRSAEATGLAYWTAQLTSAGAGNEGRVILDMISGASTANGDRQRIENKVEVGVYYAEQYVNNNLTWSTADIGEAQSAVASITFDTATVTSGKTAVDTVVITNVASNGCSISLTTATDSVTGTTKNDTIAALLGAGANNTYNTALDTIDGSAGTDTLALTISTTTGVGVISPVTTGVEVLQVRQGNASAVVLNVAGMSGLTAVNIGSASGSALQLSGLAASASISFVGAYAPGGTAGIALGLASVTGTADTLALSFASASTAGLLINVGTTDNAAVAIEAVTIANNNNSAIGSAILNLRNASAQSVTISGSQSLGLDLRSATTALTSINAAGASGNVSVLLTALGATGGNINFVGGGGNDTLTILGSALGSGDSFNGGAGTDTLGVTVDSAIGWTAISTTGIEILRINASAATTATVSALSTQLTAISVDAGNGAAVAVNVDGINANVTTLNVLGGTATAASARFTYTASVGAVTLNFGGATAITAGDFGLDGTTGQVDVVKTGTALVTIADLTIDNAATATISNSTTAAFTVQSAVSLANAGSVVINALGQGGITLGGLCAAHASAIEFNVTANNTAGGLSVGSVNALSAQTIVIDAGSTASAITLTGITVGTAINDVNITTLGATVGVSGLSIANVASANGFTANIAAGGGTANTVSLYLTTSTATAAIASGLINVTGSANVTLGVTNAATAAGQLSINATGHTGSGNLTLAFSAIVENTFTVSATLGVSVGTANVIDLGAGADVINATAGGLYKVIGRGGSDTVTFGTAQTGQHFVVVGAATGAGAAAISSANGGTDTVVLGSGDYVLVTAYQTGGTLEGAAINTANFTWLNELLGGTATAGARTSTFIGDASALSGAATGTHFAIYSAAGDTIIEVLTVTATGIAGATGNVYTLTLDNQQLAGNISGTFTFSLGSAGLAITLV